MATMDQTPDTSAGEAGETAAGAGDAASPFGMVFSHDETEQPVAPPARKAPAKRTRKTAAKNAVTAPEDPAAGAGTDGADAAAGTDGADAGNSRGGATKSTARKATARKTTARKATAKKTAAKRTTTRSRTAAAAPASESAEQVTEAEVTDAAATPATPSDGLESGTEAQLPDAEAQLPDVKEQLPVAEPQVTGDAPQAEDEDLTEDPTEEQPQTAAAAGSPFGLLFQAPDLSAVPARQPRGRRPEPTPADTPSPTGEDEARPDTGSDTGGTGSDPADGATRTTRGRGGRRTTRPAQAESPSAGAAQAPAEPVGPDSQTGGGEPAEDDGEDSESAIARRRRRRGGKGRRGRGGSPEETPGTDAVGDQGDAGDADDDGGADTRTEDESTASSVRRRRRSNRRGEDTEAGESRRAREEVTGVRGSTRLEAKRQRRREGREAGRRRSIITEAEFLARRESVERTMVVRGLQDRTQIGVLEDGVLVEHYVSRETQTTMVGNVYLGRVQNVLPSMEAAFIDIGKGRNAVLYAGEVNWDAAGLDNNQPKRIENALKSGDSVLVQVTKDPIGHKGARLTSQVSLPGRYLVLVPGNSMTGISRKLPDTERARLRQILKEVVPEGAGVIVRTAAEGASEDELRADVERLTGLWKRIEAKQQSANAPALVHGEPDMTVRVIRDVFNEDFAKVVVSGERAWSEVSDYIGAVAPDLAERLEKWTGTQDVFTHYRVTEALAKAMDRKVWLPSGGSLVIDRTEAMTVVDVNTGKFVGSGGNLEETVTRNNIEAAEEIVRQLRLRDIGGIIVIDFIDMVLESNRDLVVRRLLECLGRDRTKHQVAEVTSLGLVQMTRKRVGAGLIEVFSEPCVHCSGRGIVVHSEPIEKSDGGGHGAGSSGSSRRGRGRSGAQGGDGAVQSRPTPAPGGPTPAQIAAAAHAAAIASTPQPSAKVSDDAAVEHAGQAPAATSGGAAAGRAGEAAGPQKVTPTEEPRATARAEEPTGTPQTQAAPDGTEAAEPSAPGTSEPTPPPARGRRRASRRAQSAPTAPPATDSPTASTPQTRVAGGGSDEPASAVRTGTGTDLSEAADAGGGAADAAQGTPTTVTPGRRRGRGRVVAPAGPPVDQATAEPAGASESDSAGPSADTGTSGAGSESESPEPDGQ